MRMRALGTVWPELHEVWCLDVLDCSPVVEGQRFVFLCRSQLILQEEHLDSVDLQTTHGQEHCQAQPEIKKGVHVTYTHTHLQVCIHPSVNKPVSRSRIA